MSALSRGLLSGLAGGTAAMDKRIQADHAAKQEFGYKMSLEEFRAAKELEREKLREAYTRDIADQTAALREHDAARRDVTTRRGQDLMVEAARIRTEGGDDPYKTKLNETSRKRLEAPIVHRIVQSYLAPSGLADVIGDAASVDDLIAALYKMRDTGDVAKRSVINNAIKAAEQAKTDTGRFAYVGELADYVDDYAGANDTSGWSVSEEGGE